MHAGTVFGPKAGTLYRLKPTGEGVGICTVSELVEAVTCVFVGQEDERLPRGEWYCENSNCIVREVQIFCKLLDDADRMPAAMFCPVCQRKMKFHHWVTTTVLFPLKDGIN